VYEKVKDPELEATSRQGRENGYFGFILPNGHSMNPFEGELALREGECNEYQSVRGVACFTGPTDLRQIAFYAALLHSRATQARDFAAKNLTAAFI